MGNEDKTSINWYPGHMTKARRMMEEEIKLIDVVIELLDARAPIATTNPDIGKIAANKLLELGYTNLIEFGGILDYTGPVEK